MKRILLFPVGSSGDVHPFIGLGLEFKHRGHDVKVITNGFFRPAIERAGLSFIELGTREQYLATTENPDLWHPTKSFPLICKQIIDSLDPMLRIIGENNLPGKTILAAGSLAFGARIAQEKLKIPMATVHLQPSVYRSVIDSPVLPGGVKFPRYTPSLIILGFYRLLDVVVDKELGTGLNVYRRSIGLGTVKRVMGDWWHSPDLTLGLFPSWYFSGDGLWPSHMKFTGFPLFDGKDGVERATDGIDEFLMEGGAPLIFTGGSAMQVDQDFFSMAAKACVALNRRGMLLAQFSHQVPADLPSSVKHFTYAPFSRVFPHAAAVVHHGGIGTVSQCFKAGRPQLVIPLAHDQFDNANRVTKLSAGLTLKASELSEISLRRQLTALLADAKFAATAGDLSTRIDGQKNLRQSCDLIEQLI